MKTKNVVLSAFVALFVTVSAFAAEPVNSKLVVVNQQSGLFKVIYSGTKAGKVSMKITDQFGNELFHETIRTITGFIRPLNFAGADHGVYTIEVKDENGTLVQKLDYAYPVAAKSVHISKLAEEGKYLLSVNHTGPLDITVRIFDGQNNLVHDQLVTAKGDFGIVYNLKEVPGTPNFEVRDSSGNDLIVK